MENEILTLEEVAQYVRVSERTVYEWVQKGEIPCGKLGNVWRFKKSEVLKWLDEKLGGSPKKDSTSLSCLLKALSPDRTAILDCETKNEALNQMIEILCSSEGIKNKTEIRDALLKRERLMSTGIGLNIAVPHVRLPSISSVLMAAGISRKGISDYESLDEKPVRIIIMIAAGQNQHNEYIRLLSYISARLKKTEIREKLLKATDTETIYQTIIQD